MSKASDLDRAMAEAEAMTLSVVGRLASWVAPLPTAIMAARSIADIFTLSITWAGIISAAQELVGLTTTSLYMNAKDWNTTKRQTDPAANQRLALGCMVGYFAVDFLIILIGAGIDYERTGHWYVFGAVLFPLMGIIGVLVLNERVAQFRREAAVAEAKATEAAERKAKREEKRSAKAALAAQREAQQAQLETQPAQCGAFPEHARRTFEYYERNAGATFTATAQALGVAESTIRNHVKQLAVAGAMRRNSHGWEVIPHED